MLSKYPLITLGSPYGIGYEIFLLSLKNTGLFKNHIPYCTGSGIIMDFFQEFLGIKIKYKSINFNDIGKNNPAGQTEKFVLINIDETNFKISKPEDISGYIDGSIAFRSIDVAGNLVKEGYFTSITTLPVSKENINLIDSSFKGHTEFFQNKWNEKYVFMTFISKKINIILLSTHLSLKDVPGYITPDIVRRGILTALELKRKLGLQKKICFLGLNPHAGENGLIGKEELWIKKVISEIDTESQIDGPVPSDTAFTDFNLKKYDLYIANYHDQGLIPFKMLAFDTGVNLSFGMKYIRTSVDHGTAVDIVGKKTASLDSFINAYKMAMRLS